MNPGDAQIVVEGLSVSPHQWSEWTTPIIFYWLINAGIQSMPPPEPMERWYSWLFNFLQLVAANIKQIGVKKV